jgi:biopolymer transport protein ExbD
MAGGGGGLELPERQRRGKKHSKRKKKKRLGFRIDMTPMVDIVFLLLTFFMYTTTMVTPQVMEISVPKEVEENVEVNQANLFTLYVRGDGKLFFSMGTDDPQPLEYSQLRSKAVELNMLRKNKLITAFKPSPDAPYGAIVQVLDILNQAEAEVIRQLQAEGIKRERKFAFVKISPEEVEKLKGL